MAKYFDEEGQEIEAIPTEEVQKIQEERDALAQEKADLLAEKERLEAGGADKDENFRKMRGSLEEKDKQINEITKRLNDKEEYERSTTKEALLSHYAGDDEEARKALEEEVGFINLPEDNLDNIAKKYEKAARVRGLYKEGSNENPVFKGIWGGSAPHLKPTKPAENDADNIVNTDKGKSALNAMGIPTEEKK